MRQVSIMFDSNINIVKTDLHNINFFRFSQDLKIKIKFKNERQISKSRSVKYRYLKMFSISDSDSDDIKKKPNRV